MLNQQPTIRHLAGQIMPAIAVGSALTPVTPLDFQRLTDVIFSVQQDSR